MTDSTQELDKMLREYKLAVTDDTGSAWQQEERIAEAKQALLDWHNKQVAIAQERAYHASIQSIEMLMRNEHEQRNKLKESK